METVRTIKDEDDRKQVLCLFISRRYYDHFKEYYQFLVDEGHDNFSIEYVNLAIEYDAYDILALLQKTYPEQFEENEQEFISSLIKSFENSCGFLQQKLELLTTLVVYLSFE